jgi:hypothetical protein
MKRILSTLLFISCSLCVPMIAMGQDFPSLREKAENTIKTKRPEMELSRKLEKGKRVIYQWGSKDYGVRLVIFYGTSQEDAAEKMNYSISHISVSPHKKLADIGDEAYLWTSRRGDFAAIRFRKSNVYIELSAPSLAMAEDLTKSLAKLIKKK